MSAPVYTAGSTGNLLASQSLLPLATVSFDVDASAAFEAQVRVTVTATNVTDLTPGLPAGAPHTFGGVVVGAYCRVGNPAATDTAPTRGWAFAAVANATVASTESLPTGRWHVTIASTDPNNSITVSATDDTVAAVT